MQNLKNMQIALVDDDSDEATIFQIALELIGIDSKFNYYERAFDFLSHIENPKNSLPDIVFVDMKMPKISGQEMIAKIKENTRFDSIKAIIYTAHISEAQKLAMEAMGPYEFFIKPTELEDLIAMLKGIISNHK